MPELNVPLLRKTMEHIEAHPDEHYQGLWAVKTHLNTCGTAFCFAGWAVVLAGGEIVWGGEDGPNDTQICRIGDSHPGYISDAAQDQLGLTQSQAEVLFCGVNTRPRLRQMVDTLIAGGEL